MIKNKIITLILLAFVIITNAQNTFTSKVLDSENNEVLIGATILLKGTTNGVNTNTQGSAILENIPNGKQKIIVSYIGYQESEIIYTFPEAGLVDHKIKLTPSDSEIDEIIIEATRGNRTVANLPTRTEVLTEEIDEAASMEASKISHLITHSTGIQVQTTAAGSNGAVVRIQGLNGRYTQILKDGFPLYGVINLLTKKADKDETLLHINLSHIGARDFNAFTSKRFGKWGFTNLASMHIHNPYDPNKDGLSDIAQVSKFNFNPKLFYNPNRKIELYLGSTISKENRKGGSISKIRNENTSGEYFLDEQESSRVTSQFSAKYKWNDTKLLTLKNSISSFDRYINIDENILGTSNKFGGNQLNSFTELNLNINKETQNINIGFNSLSDIFTEDYFMEDTLRNQEYQTLGIYINHLW
ncbi:MAG: TonB-dependent receptor, partial [Flavobacteriales bacterium]